ncbi:hypothetical protein AVEN_66763-1 [Araneus ventricosus]|uniref:Uncharacterized protein n=1 Tax=Araneus ventricosus TaxID=182803 RepID=A0A4Y2HRT0_ARAVE|nr:hypothetical protein AVEN_66763-1 [Araneus ventricosus]
MDAVTWFAHVFSELRCQNHVVCCKRILIMFVPDYKSVDFDVTLDRFASRIDAEFIIFMEFFSLILGVDQLAASRLQLDSRNLPEFL